MAEEATAGAGTQPPAATTKEARLAAIRAAPIEPPAEPEAPAEGAEPAPAPVEDPSADDAGLDALQKREASSRAGMDKEYARRRQELDDEFAQKVAEFKREQEGFVEQWKPRIDKLDAFESWRDRARHDPLAVVDALTEGYAPEDVGRLANIMFARAQKTLGETDEAKKLGEKNEQDWMRKHREMTRTASLENELRSMRAEMTRYQNGARADKVSASAASAIGDETPLVRALQAKAPDHVSDLLREATEKLIASGKDFQPKDVVAIVEKNERDFLTRRGLDPMAVFAIQAAKVAAKPDASKTTAVPEEKTPLETSKKNEVPNMKPTKVLTKQERLALVRGEG